MDRLGDPLHGGNGVSGIAYAQALKFGCPTVDNSQYAIRKGQVFHHFTGTNAPKGVWVSGDGVLFREIDNSFEVQPVR